MLQNCTMHARCSIGCPIMASRQPAAGLLQPARSFSGYRACNLAGHSRKQKQFLNCRWQLKAAVG